MKGPRLLLRDPNVATYPFMCSIDTNERLGKIQKVGEAMVAVANSRPRNFVPVSSFASGQVRPAFKKNYFKLCEISFPSLPGKFRISRGKSRGNQDQFVDDVCVYFPLKRYEQVLPSGEILKKKGTDRSECVGFRAAIGVLIIEFTWNAGDDFDLAVIEPDGNEIDVSIPNSATGGRLIKDNNVGTCGIAPVGREQMAYRTRASPLAGDYKIEVRHFTSCGSPVEYSLVVVANGKKKLIRSGTADVGRNQLVLTETFSFP